MKKEIIINEVKLVSKNWVENFNKGNIKKCIDVYTDDALMIVKNKGDFKGKNAIKEFWLELTKKAKSISYFNTSFEFINNDTVHLKSNWKMDICEGIITLEKWQRQQSGQWKLIDDRFEVLKEKNTN